LVPATAVGSLDLELLAMGRELDSISAALDRAGEHGEAMALLERVDVLSAAMVAMPAKTLQGLRAKARATVWALEHDFDPSQETSINNRLEASIVRDLLRLGTS